MKDVLKCTPALIVYCRRLFFNRDFAEPQASASGYWFSVGCCFCEFFWIIFRWFRVLV